MVAKARKKGLFYRLKRVFDWLSRRYRRWEEPVIGWAMKKGVPAMLASLLGGLVRLLLIGGFLGLVFWILVVVVGVLTLKEILLNSSEIEDEEEPVWMDGERLFPDPYSVENRIDPAFHRDL
ncbi:DUF3742 family protein [Pseudomonas asplenii]|uniref:DUF3742 family protein n=1 Tax=Pseudomonas asplenii TaxID=53407 RepID=UPI0006B3FCBA|nr:DUF3742 family protein [Pseudomonas fuscovaginae]